MRPCQDRTRVRNLSLRTLRRRRPGRGSARAISIGLCARSARLRRLLSRGRAGAVSLTLDRSVGIGRRARSATARPARGRASRIGLTGCGAAFTACVATTTCAIDTPWLTIAARSRSSGRAQASLFTCPIGHSGQRAAARAACYRDQTRSRTRPRPVLRSAVTVPVRWAAHVPGASRAGADRAWCSGAPAN